LLTISLMCCIAGSVLWLWSFVLAFRAAAGPDAGWYGRLPCLLAIVDLLLIAAWSLLLPSLR